MNYQRQAISSSINRFLLPEIICLLCTGLDKRYNRETVPDYSLFAGIRKILYTSALKRNKYLLDEVILWHRRPFI